MRATPTNRALDALTPLPGGLPRRRGTWLLALFVVLAAAHTWHPVGNFGDATYLGVTLGAGAVGLAAALRLPRDRRYPWFWIATGVMSSGIGDFCYTAVTRIRDEQPDVSIADVFYLASYIALAIGLMNLLARRRLERRFDRDDLIDLGSIFILTVILVSYVADVGQIFADHSVSAVTRVVWAAYPVLDATLLSLLVPAILGRRLRGVSGAMIAAGIGSWLASDFAYMWIADVNPQSAWMDLGWMLGATSISYAVMNNRGSRSSDRQGRVGVGSVLIALTPLAVPGAIETWFYIRGYDPNPVPMFFAGLALFALAIARAVRLVRARDFQEAQLRHSERYFEALTHSSADAVIVVDTNGRIVNDAPRLADMIGFPGMVTTGAYVPDLVAQPERKRAQAILNWLASADESVHKGEVQITHADGSNRWFGLRAVNLTDDPVVDGIVVNIHDITDAKLAEDELARLAFHDSLTGLTNRVLFHDRLEQALKRTARSNDDVAIVYMDIDSFKTVNDSRGHESGDQVLQQIAARLLSTVRPADTVARLGGDEFAILIESSRQPLEEASKLADRVLTLLEEPLGPQQVVLSASIGITISDGLSTVSSMLRDADIAMYQAKTTGKNRWALYDPRMRAAAVEFEELQNDLSRALAENQFRLVYQPILELRSERVVGFEALLRWHHPTRGLIAPGTFSPIAEGNGSIIAIGQWVLNEACRTAAQWRLRDTTLSLSMAVNISARELESPDIVDRVRNALYDSGLPPEALVLELTESVLVEDPIASARRLHELRDLGLKLAIDDFGTGYSSLSYLGNFPVDILKIDQTFINTITSAEELPAIVLGLLSLAETLKLETVAEGIALNVQLQALRSRCKFGQGYLFAEPLSPESAGQLLELASWQRACTEMAGVAGQTR
ncbi:MAG: EAL domain-containing protein [Actinobacteria bacterium]|nr:EAL domain-containing protein [Actinomycetota bacterium]